MEWRDVSIPHLLLVALVFALLATGVYAVSTSSAAFSVYNSDWDGTSDLRSTVGSGDTDVEVVHETAAYSSVAPEETVAFVLSPDEAYRPTDAAQVGQFVRSGGTLVVADDFGPHGNDLLRKLNASARFDGRLLRDGRSNYRSTAMPVATRVADRESVADVESVTLNHGTAVRPNGATPLVNTSEYAYLDADQDGTISGNETLRSRSVATVERVGDGQVVVVGDSSVFINAMLERSGNRAFARALAADRTRVLVDFSRTDRAPPVMQGLFAVRDSTALQLGLGWFVAVALAVWSRRADSTTSARWSSALRPSALRASALWPSAFRSSGAASAPDDRAGATRDELVAHLERRHPEWERERVERVVSALERRRDRGDGDAE